MPPSCFAPNTKQSMSQFHSFFCRKASMESHPSLELESRGLRSRRRRPLNSAGVSFLAIASVAYARAIALDLNAWPPLLLVIRFVKMVAKMMVPLLSFIHSLCFPLLSFVDDYILAVERVAEKIFPPSAHVFNKIDQLLQFADTLPVKLDDAISRLPIVIHDVPSLDWALGHVISLLNFIVLNLRGRRQESTAEKEIMVDSSCSEDRLAATQFHGTGGNTANFAPATQTHDHESEAVKEEAMHDITKEVLEKGMEVDIENEEEIIVGVEMNKKESREEEEEEEEEKEQEQEAERNEEPVNGSTEGSRVDEDQILELFESGWLMKQAGKGK